MPQNKPRKAKKGEILSDQIGENYAHYAVLCHKTDRLTKLVTGTYFVLCALLGTLIGLSL